MPRPDYLYQTLLTELRRQLTASFVPGEMLPSQRALALMHGVGQSTVNRAMRALVTEGLVQIRPRIGWVRGNAIGRESRPVKGSPDFRRTKGRALRVGLITRRSAPEWTLYEIYPALEKEAQRRGIEVVRVMNPRTCHPTPSRNRIELSLVPWNTFDVALLVEVEDPITLSDPLLRRHVVLAVDQDASVYGIHSASFDDAGAGRLAARHLFELGHRRFAVTDEVNDPGWPWDPAWTARRHGFESTVGRLGGCIRPGWRVELGRARSHFDFAKHVRTLAKTWAAAPANQRPTALFCVDDSVLPMLAAEFAAEGVRIPQDLSVITITWRREPLVDSLNPTRIQLDLPVLVRRVLDAAEELAAAKSKPAAAQVFLAPALLVQGDSTRAPNI